jgi:hypothetical protein
MMTLGSKREKKKVGWRGVYLGELLAFAANGSKLDQSFRVHRVKAKHFVVRKHGLLKVALLFSQRSCGSPRPTHTPHQNPENQSMGLPQCTRTEDHALTKLKPCVFVCVVESLHQDRHDEEPYFFFSRVETGRNLERTLLFLEALDKICSKSAQQSRH